MDPTILSQDVIAKAINNRMQDMATSVREAAVDLIGRFILTRPEVANQYYKMLTERILDTGVSVRKRVIKILRDLCLEVKNFPYIGDACVRIIKCRVLEFFRLLKILMGSWVVLGEIDSQFFVTMVDFKFQKCVIPHEEHNLRPFRMNPF